MAQAARHRFDLASLNGLDDYATLLGQCKDLADRAFLVALGQQDLIDATASTQGLSHRIAADQHIFGQFPLSSQIRSALTRFAALAALPLLRMFLAVLAVAERLFLLIAKFFHHQSFSRSFSISWNLPQVMAPSGQRPVFTQLAPALWNSVGATFLTSASIL